MKKKELEIHNNWLERFDWLCKDEVECIVCGAVKHLEKCHLIPKGLGGSETPDNLVMLCHEHHRQAPNTSISKDIMLNWIEREAKKFSKTRGLGMSNELWDRFEKSGVKFLRKVGDRLEKQLTLEDVTSIMDFLSEKTMTVPSHSKYNYKETLVNTMEFLNTSDNYLDEFVKDLIENTDWGNWIEVKNMVEFVTV